MLRLLPWDACAFQSAGFSECVEDIGLVDLTDTGPAFTWSNRRVVGLLARKLDRVMVNSLRLDEFSDCEAKFLPPELSDHCAGLLINKHQEQRRNRPFKFFNYLLEPRSFLSVIHDSWSTSTAY